MYGLVGVRMFHSLPEIEADWPKREERRKDETLRRYFKEAMAAVDMICYNPSKNNYRALESLLRMLIIRSQESAIFELLQRNEKFDDRTKKGP